MAVVELSPSADLAESGTGGKSVIGALFYCDYVCALDSTLCLTKIGLHTI